MSNKSETRREWYDNLKKSPLTPPSIVISIVWFLLYIMILISFVVYVKNKPTPLGISIFIISFLINLTWYPVFFNARQIGIGLIIIICLLISIIATIWQVQLKSNLSAWLLVPYLLWVAFATYLNMYIKLNN
jgi:benzodiazapine receptor